MAVSREELAGSNPVSDLRGTPPGAEAAGIGSEGREKMKAIVIDGYGGVERLQLRDLPEPVPGEGEVLVRARAAGVNPLDWKIRQGRLRHLISVRFPFIPGSDIAGEVVATGAGAVAFKPGDAVLGFLEMRRGGGYAELAVAKESALALKPQALSFAEAGAMPIAAGTALQALRGPGGVSGGKHVLILGGAGGVGHFAVQIAKALGAARVTATCGSANVEFLRTLGADTVIDYGREDFTTRADERYDLIFDTVAKSSFMSCRHLLTPDGVYVTTLPALDLFLWDAVQRILRIFGPAQQARLIVVRPRGADLAFLGELAEQGKLKPVVSAAYPLARAAEAQEASAGGHVRGKIVLETGSGE